MDSAGESKDASLVSYDLGNLLTFDSSPINSSEFSQNPEEFLRNHGRESAQLLLNQIFSLETEPLPPNLGIGRLAILPAPNTALPREKHVPKPKPPTKWEQFARLKGIQKRKRGAKVWDEESKEWKRRWGYDRANNELNQWVVEAKASDDGSVDPWTRMKQEKKERVAKNEAQRLKNLKAAEGKRVPGTIDLTSAVSQRPGKRKQSKPKEKTHVDVALSVAQKSTASMGKFDSKRYNEPARKQAKTSKNSAPSSYKSEKEQSLSVLSRILAPENKESARFSAEKAVNLQKQFQEGGGGRPKGKGKGGKGQGKGKKEKGKRVQQVGRKASQKKKPMSKKRHQE